MCLPTHKNQSSNDWHAADIKAALEKKGYSFARIARENGYKGSRSTSNVLRIQWPQVEAIVGEILNCHPMEIWPSRYDSKGTPLRSRFTDTLSKGKKRRNK